MGERDNTMTYKKPEIQSICDAVNIIQTLETKCPWGEIDPTTGLRCFNPAYGLDE